MRRLAPLLGLLLVLAACGDDDTGPGDTTSSTGPATTSPDPPTSSTAAGVGLPAIGVLTAAAGNGERPLLEWEAVAEAARYAVTISTADGRAYWAWVGDDTSVYLGGGDGATDTAGPVLSGPMTMTVLAFDAANTVIAASPPTPIAP